MVENPLADMLIRIKNGYLAKKAEVVVPWSKVKQSVAKVLVEEGYLEAQEVKDQKMTLKLKKGGLTDIKIISKPSLRVYVKKDQLPRVLGGLGVAVISTPAGVLTSKDAAKKGLGGEVLCEVW